MPRLQRRGERTRWRAVLVGGEASFVEDKFKPHLRELGIEVVKHWPWKTTRFGWPTSGVDLIITITGQMDHKMVHRTMIEAEKLGVPVTMTVHKWSVAAPRIERTLAMLSGRGSRAFISL